MHYKHVPAKRPESISNRFGDLVYSILLYSFNANRDWAGIGLCKHLQVHDVDWLQAAEEQTNLLRVPNFLVFTPAD